MKLWLEFKTEFSHIRSLGGKWEKQASETIGHPMKWVQFDRDVKLYGLYQAVDMVDEEEIRQQLRDVFLELYAIDHKDDVSKAAMHALGWDNLDRRGTVVEKTTSSWRPESIWTLQEHFIRGCDYLTISDKKPTLKQSVLRMFEITLPIHISQKHIDDTVCRGLWNGVRDVPIAYREQLCARMIKLFDVPLPPEPKTPKHHVVTGVEKPSRDRVLVIDKSGNAWTWNCGWFRVGENGQRLDTKPCLGHATFKRVIIPASPEDFKRTAFHYTRPWGQWRRGQGPVAHELFGNGSIILTDGLHAVVDFVDGVRREVVLANLKNIGERQLTRAKTETTGERAPRKQTKKELSLEEMMKML